MLEKFPTMVAAATFIVLSLAVTHEWGYYAQFDPRIQGLVAPSDYFKSALLWLPTIAITYFVMATLTVLQWRAAEFKLLPQRGQWLLHLVGLNFVALSAISFFYNSPIESWTVYSVAIAYLWSLIVGYVARHEEVTKRFTFAALLLIMFLPPGLAFAYSFGTTEGRRDLSKRNGPTYTLTTKGKYERTRPVILLRALDKGALVRDQNEVQFYGWSDVLSLQISPKPSDSSHSCQLFGSHCPP